MSRARTRGFTLIELIIFIVVVSAGLAGILSVMNTVVKSSADPMVRKQAVAIAESILEEILQKEYCEPDTVSPKTSPPTCATNIVESGRNDYNDVDDYKGKTETLFNSASGAGGWPVALDGYQVTIHVADAAAVSGVQMKKITVTVNRSGESIALSGYRANY